MKTCSVEDCERPQWARTFCTKHYSTWLRLGDPQAAQRYVTGTPEERLRQRLRMDGDCLVFEGADTGSGYGMLKVDGRMVKTHRLAYELWVGPIPPGMSVCHTCDNRRCCKPSHLWVGTHDDNMRDMATKGRSRRGEYDAAFYARQGQALRERAAERRIEAAIAAGYPATFKKCSRCDTFQDPENFGANLGRPDGLQTYCHACRSVYMRQRRERLHAVRQGRRGKP